jgi:hypothetical protein
LRLRAFGGPSPHPNQQREESIMAANQNPIQNLSGSDQVRYLIDPRLSRFAVHVSATGVLSFFGHNPNLAIRDFTGEVQWQSAPSPGDPSPGLPSLLEAVSLHVMARAASLQVVDDISDKDRGEIERQVQEEVLESQTYPEIAYACSRVFSTKTQEGQDTVTLNGNLTLHGVTNPLLITAHTVLSGDAVRAFGEFSLRQTDYNIKLVRALAGAVKVKDELAFSFDIAARKQL